MRPTAQNQEPSVIYARINHNRQNPNAQGSNYNAPLLISTGGANGANGGGVSPSSLMNTSMDSSSAASTSSRNHGSGSGADSGHHPPHSKIRRSGRTPCSLDDEGFDSPVGTSGQNEGMPIIISPQSDVTRDTMNLVSSKPLKSILSSQGSPGSSGNSSMASSYESCSHKKTQAEDPVVKIPLLADCRESKV